MTPYFLPNDAMIDFEKVSGFSYHDKDKKNCGILISGSNDKALSWIPESDPERARKILAELRNATIEINKGVNYQSVWATALK